MCHCGERLALKDGKGTCARCGTAYVEKQGRPDPPVNVPILDLKAQHAAIRDALMQKVMPVIEGQTFILGQSVTDLEVRIAALSHAKHGIGVASGTDALLLPLKALDLKPGDEVITSPFTFFATAGAIHNAGGRSVFVDIDPVTYCLDPAQVEAAITPRTRAIVPVHLYGQMAAMERLMPLGEKRGIAVIEDACQSIGARRKVAGEWRTAGELGRRRPSRFSRRRISAPGAMPAWW